MSKRRRPRNRSGPNAGWKAELEQKGRDQMRALKDQLDHARKELRELRAQMRRDQAIAQGALPMPKSDFRGLTIAEQEFVEQAIDRGWALYRAGWPDFLCFDPARKLFLLVEVRSEREKLLESQRQTFTALEHAGFQVRIYRPGRRSLVPWRKEEADLDA